MMSTHGSRVWAILFTLAVVVCTTQPVWARSPVLMLTESATPDAFPIFTGGKPAAIFLDELEPKVVSIAAGLFASDVALVTGQKPSVGGVEGLAGAQLPDAVLVGTIGQSRLIDALNNAGKLDVSAIKGQWEAFTLAIVVDPMPGVKRALVIAGSNRRGTAYGLMTLSETIGVSPWYWWADVPPTKRQALYVTVPASFHDAPGVKYRGIFINDEDWGINPWASKTFDPQFKNIGPKTYEKVFELMLRLRLNYIWPAMHSCSTEFGSVPENAELADQYGIVAGASHCEPMLYNNVKWNVKSKGPWNYDTNRDMIHSCWEQYAKERGDKEAVWTLGIRGIHDAPMNGPKDMPGRINLVSKAITDQRQLLDKYVTNQWGPVAQCFVPYKEVLPIYDAGLNVPADVTLVWVDDNFGYIRRLSSPEERKRPGGSGVYWHLSYYGGPHSYTWINTTPPALIWEELHKAWENEARTIWMINVGDIKPMEVGIDYYSRLAWDPDGFGADSQPLFLRDFAAKTFGQTAAQPAADLLMEFYRLGTIRKPELMNRAWACSLPPQLAEKLSHDYDDLLHREETVLAALPRESRDAFTETVGFPAQVLGSAGLIFMADRKVQEGIDTAANESAIERLRHNLEARVEDFNLKIAGGKWNRMMPGLETGKDLAKWSSQVRWPWGEKPAVSENSAPASPLSTGFPAGQTWRDAAAADRQFSPGVGRWSLVAGLGPSGRAMALLPATVQTSWTEGSGDSPCLEFDFTAPGGDADAWVDFLPTFRTYPGMKMRVAVSVDDHAPASVEVPGADGKEDERGAVRASAVQDNFVQLRVPLPNLSAGRHTFKIRAIDPGAVIDKISLP